MGLLPIYYRCVYCGSIRVFDGVRNNGVTTERTTCQEEVTVVVLMGKVIYPDRCGRCVETMREKEEQHVF